MVQQADSILTAETALEAAEQQQVQKQHGSQLTPKQVQTGLIEFLADLVFRHVLLILSFLCRVSCTVQQAAANCCRCAYCS